MAGPHRRSLVPVAALFLLLLAAGMAAAAADGPSEGNIKIQVRYPTEEESRWLDHWAAKYPPVGGSGSDDFKVHPATDEESAYLNRMVPNANKRAAEGSGDGRGGAAGLDGHLVFDEHDRPCVPLLISYLSDFKSSSCS